MMQNVHFKRRQLYRLLGDLPSQAHPITVVRSEILPSQDYWLEKLLLDLNGIEAVPAYFVKPKETIGRLPTVLYNHAHGGRYDIGKDELLYGNELLQAPPYACALTSRGYAALCIDAWAFGERSSKRESELFKEMLWSGRVMWGMMVYDSLRAVDYLAARPDVDASRLATLGMSMGSTMAWWLAALDERLQVCIDICCLTDFQALLDARGLDLHGLYYYVPSLLKHFTTAQINALIAPRPHLSLAGELDPLTPPIGLDRVDAELKRVYLELGASDAWQLKRYSVAHLETAEMRQEVIDFLDANFSHC
jgi:dienelactone hydrolase